MSVDARAMAFMMRLLVKGWLLLCDILLWNIQMIFFFRSFKMPMSPKNSSVWIFPNLASGMFSGQLKMNTSPQYWGDKMLRSGFLWGGLTTSMFPLWLMAFT